MSDQTQTPYDSTEDTIAHINQVAVNMDAMIGLLHSRKAAHDQSKLFSPEKELFDQYTPILKELEYGSDAYKESLRLMGPALLHHYQHNTHHPEHFGYQECNGCYERFPLDWAEPCDKCGYNVFSTRSNIAAMSLLDIFEMLADWKAAGQRTSNGSILASLVKNKDRFGISDDLAEIIENTVKELGW